MQMKAPHPSKKARIEIIPLIDVIFFLLATFVLISLSMTRIAGERVKLPESKTAEPPKLDNTVTLSVTKLGAIYWDKDVMNWDQFVLKIGQLGQDNPTANIMINADEGSAFGQTASVMDEVRKAGFKKVGIQTVSVTKKS